jgi:hypothetical protein
MLPTAGERRSSGNREEINGRSWWRTTAVRLANPTPPNPTQPHPTNDRINKLNKLRRITTQPEGAVDATV